MTNRVTVIVTGSYHHSHLLWKRTINGIDGNWLLMKTSFESKCSCCWYFIFFMLRQSNCVLTDFCDPAVGYIVSRCHMDETAQCKIETIPKCSWLVVSPHAKNRKFGHHSPRCGWKKKKTITSKTPTSHHHAVGRLSTILINMYHYQLQLFVSLT